MKMIWGRLEASERLSLKRQVRSAPSLQLETSGGEIGAIFAELQHLNRGLIETRTRRSTPRVSAGPACRYLLI
jgi:hypothetical protein